MRLSFARENLVRAMFDYEGAGNEYMSFRKGDVIDVVGTAVSLVFCFVPTCKFLMRPCLDTP